MLIKTLTLHSLAYIVGITGSVAVHQVIPPMGRAADFKSDTSVRVGMANRQIVNRSIKSDRLQARPHANDEAPVHEPGQFAPNPKQKTDCKPPIDFLGRCFADASVNHKVA